MKQLTPQETLSQWLSNKDDYSLTLPDESILIAQGQKNALNLFHQASDRIPAYQDFLYKNNIKAQLVKSIDDFEQIPPTTKENYIQEYELTSRCWDGDISLNHMIAASSGSTGKPHFWPRYPEIDIEGAYIHELIFKYIFKSNRQKTLFSNSFSLGNWIAGMYTHACINLLSLKGYNLTTVTPGLSEEETLKIIKEISPYFDKTVIAGHPPTIKMFIHSAYQLGIDVKALNINFLGAGEGITEEWRDYLLQIVGQNQPSAFINIYGSADAGLIAFETPLSISLRRHFLNQSAATHEIFKQTRIPYLYQFDPRRKYIESVGDEITLTSNSGVPLIRYNIHDAGGVISSTQLRSSSLLIQSEEGKLDNFPIVYTYGRSYGMATIYAVNIYPEHIKQTLDHEYFQQHFTGRFVLVTQHDESQKQYLQIRLELRKGTTSLPPRHKINIVNRIIEQLKKINSEYSKLERELGSLPTQK